jgi:phospholipid/cholesterol/gamma-HCH transport system substrate-binding protein
MVLRAGEMYIRPGYTIKFIFDTVSGVDKGSPVRLAGVPIGEVKRFHTLENKDGKLNVEIEAFVDAGVKIEQDADLRVATMGFLGEKYIDIHPGTPGTPLIEPGGSLVGRQLTGMDDVFDSGQKLLQKMEYVAEDLREVVGDPEFKKAAKGTFVQGEKTFQNLESATADLKESAASMKVVTGRLRDGEGTIGKLLKEDRIYKDLEAFVADIKKNPWKLLKKS